MFPKWSNITIAADNYCDTVDFPIGEVSRKQSIASYNIQQKTMFFSHINKVIKERMDVDYKLVKLTAINPLNEVYEVVCTDETEIMVLRGNYAMPIKINELRNGSSLLIDHKGFICKVISVEPTYDGEDYLIDVKSNKGNSKFINGLMFKA